MYVDVGRDEQPRSQPVSVPGHRETALKQTEHIPMVDFAVQLLELITGASTTSTYKYALLTSLVDLCQENVGHAGGPRGSVTTRQIAQRVLELYWPQTRPHHSTGSVLRQLNDPRKSGTYGRIARFRSQLTTHGARTVHTAKAEDADGYVDLLDEVEWTFIRYPIPLLQNAGRERLRLIYEIGWDVDVKQGAVKGYQRRLRGLSTRAAPVFDNTVRFLDCVEEHLSNLAGLLRPLIRREWSRFVTDRNGDFDDLDAFLFEPTREVLTPVRAPLKRLQAGRCFYCQQELRSSVEVDHFLPWAKCADDQLHNLVVSHRGCNSKKRDHLAGTSHVDRWRKRNARYDPDLCQIGQRLNWPADRDRSIRLGRALYLHQGAAPLLWVEGDQFERGDRETLARLLAEA